MRTVVPIPGGAAGVIRIRREHPVGLHRRTVETNEWGDEIETLGPEETVLVPGWYIGGGAVSGPDGHVYRTEWDGALFAPVALGIAPGDRVTLPGHGPFIVDGPPGNWDHGPFGWEPGLVEVKLKKVGDPDGSGEAE